MTDSKPASRLEQRKSQNPSVDWGLRHKNFVRRMLAFLERVSLLFEAPITKLIRDPRYNPLYHTGTITVFLLGLILITGVYLTMFYQFGFTASYETIVRLENNFFNALMRAAHRYASGAALITGLLHGWRTFFQDRFRGPRWLAWVTGVAMTAFFWAIGVSGYWLLWDQRAQVINQSLIRLIANSRLGSAFLVHFLTTSQAGSGWIFLLLVLTVHLGLSLFVGLFLWWHLKRLSRPKWLPPPFWMAASALLLILASALIPVGVLPSINPTQYPGQVPIDPLFLAYLPAALTGNPALFWGGILLLIALASSLPWLLHRKALKPVAVDLTLCDGCVLCSRDCPYNAITMMPRSDGARPTFQAEVNQSLCVSCGICIGSCPEKALGLGLPIDPFWEQTAQRAASANLVFTCERHLLQGSLENDPDLQVVPLTCMGMLHPDLIGAAIDGGADSVRVVGCPPEDCANREGNLWLQQRLDRERLPRLRIGYTQVVIHTDWIAPGSGPPAINNSPATAYSIDWPQLDWRSFLPAVVLVAFTLAFQVGSNNIAYTAFPQDQALLEVSLSHHSGYPLQEAEVSQPNLGIDMSTRLIIEVDDQVMLDQEYPLQGRGLGRVSTAFEQIPLRIGVHQIRILMMDRPDQEQPFVMFEQQITFSSRQRLALSFSDASLGSDPVAGRKLYFETSLGTNAGCRICHSLETGQTLVGPSFAGLAERAAGRVPGMTAEEYIRQSILEPDAYIVEGFPSGQMIPNLDEVLSEAQINELIAYLMTIKEE
jgi:ferredoxin